MMESGCYIHHHLYPSASDRESSVLNLRVPWNAGKLSSGPISSGLSSSAQLHRVSQLASFHKNPTNDFFVGYFTTLLVARLCKFKQQDDIWDNEVDGAWKVAIMVSIKYYPSIFQEGLNIIASASLFCGRLS
jgi:hypothetical protein